MIDNSNFRKPPTILVLPPAWQRIPRALNPVHLAYEKALIRRLFVIVGEERHNGQWWRHISCSTPRALPSWEELEEVKRIFAGRDAKAIQVLPPDSEKVNIHPFCLHLWSPLEADPLPDFREIFDGEGI